MPFDGTDFHVNPAVENIDAVIELIGDERRWCKGALLNARGQMCLMGALHRVKADAALIPAMLETAREVSGKMIFTLESFNDDGATTHAMVLEVLRRTREKVEAGRYIIAPPPPAATRCRWLLQKCVLGARAYFT